MKYVTWDNVSHWPWSDLSTENEHLLLGITVNCVRVFLKANSIRAGDIQNDVNPV